MTWLGEQGLTIQVQLVSIPDVDLVDIFGCQFDIRSVDSTGCGLVGYGGSYGNRKLDPLGPYAGP